MAKKVRARGKQGEVQRRKHPLKDPMERMFRENGYIVMNSRHYRELKDDLELMVVKNFPYEHIYGHIARTDYLLINKQTNRRIRIDCSWQKAAGGAEWKFPCMYLNSIFGYKEYETIFVIDGGGSQPRARRWLRRVAREKWLVDEAHPKLVRVMTLAEFKEFFMEQLVDYSARSAERDYAP